MRRKTKLFAALFAVILAIAALCPMLIANAATVKTIAAETYVKVSSDKYLYKITVTKEGYITLYGKVTKKTSYAYGHCDFRLLNSHKEEFSENYPDYVYVSSGNKTDSLKYAVSKGTYYIQPSNYYNSDNSVTVSVKYKFTAVTQPTNYCVGNAKSLSAGTVSKIYQTPKKNFDRWYKITLSSNKKVTVTTDMYCKLFDDRGNEISLEYSSSKYSSKIKLAKGTYYIKAYEYDEPFHSACYSLKWS